MGENWKFNRRLKIVLIGIFYYWDLLGLNISHTFMFSCFIV